jgi:heme-degrading monooxygenase HmoA
MISRHWIGVIKKDKLEEYLTYLESAVLPKLANVEGLRNTYYLKREVAEGIEFLIVTEWDNVEAIVNFAGQEYDRAVVDEYSKSLLITYDKTVRHYVI